jgi:DnaD/phage-associated family protein
MARKRFVSSEMSTDEDIADIAVDNPVSALMWPWFITGFDDWGRMEVTSPNKVRLELFPAFPYKANEVQEAIEQFSKAGIVFRYSVDSRTYLAIEPCKFYKYQTYIRDKKRIEDSSNYPAPVNPPWAKCAKCREIARIGKTTYPMGEDDEKKRTGAVFQFYQNNIGLITPFQAEEIIKYLDEGMEPELIISVMQDSIGKDIPWDWIKKVLANSDKNNIKTLAQYDAKKVEKERKKGEKGKPQNGKPTFNNFTNRTYDTKKLEEAMLQRSRDNLNPEYDIREGESTEEWQKRILAMRNKGSEDKT